MLSQDPTVCSAILLPLNKREGDPLSRTQPAPTTGNRLLTAHTPTN